MDPSISVIIPAYNAENCVARCLDSVFSQSYPNLQVIVVNDGSEDNTGEILKEYQAKHNNLIVVEQENGGLSNARNSGMDVSSGEYIAFIDADDTVDKDYFENLLSAALKSNAEITVCGCRNIDVSTNELLYEDSPQKHLVQTSNGRNIVFWGVAWGKLYNASLIRGRCYFSGRLFEDDPYTIMAHSLAKKIVALDYIGYNYYTNNPNSLLGKEAKERKIAEKFPCAAYENAIKTVIDFGNDVDFKYLQIYYLSNMMGILFREINRKEARNIVELHYRLCKEYSLTKKIGHMHLPIKTRLKLSFMIFVTKMRWI